MPTEDDAKRDDILYFLRDLKECIGENRFYVTDRVKNQEALIELGLTERIREDEIYSLTLSNYCSGPEQDHDRPGSVWIFGKKIDGVEVYIKLKIFNIKGTDQAKCISFHIATSSPSIVNLRI
jgi:hypothetical protein